MGSLLSLVEDLYLVEEGATTSPSFVELLATCHSVKEVRGKLLGDPVDLRMREFTGWTFEEVEKDLEFVSGAPNVPPVNLVDVAYVSKKNLDNKILIAKCFDFESALQRMSVVTQDSITRQLSIQVKGSPELIASLCIPSTVPQNFSEELNAYTIEGYRVIACASRFIQPQALGDLRNFTRKDAEQGLVFKGLLILENKVKPESTPSLKALRAASFRNVMITGDNILTAIAVGRVCAICRADVPIYKLLRPEADGLQKSTETAGQDEPVEIFEQLWSQVHLPDQQLKEHSDDFELAISGTDYHYLKDNASERSFHKILMKCQIYARMTPVLKKTLVEEYQDLGYCVGMCGDGANDCSALKAADVGLSLSESEASVAAPFTSQNANVSGVLRLIREGRAALVTSLSCFKYMALYAMIQTCTVTMLYSLNSNLADFQFLYIDLVLILPLALCSKSPLPNLSKTKQNNE